MSPCEDGYCRRLPARDHSQQWPYAPAISILPFHVPGFLFPVRRLPAERPIPCTHSSAQNMSLPRMGWTTLLVTLAVVASACSSSPSSPSSTTTGTASTTEVLLGTVDPFL